MTTTAMRVAALVAAVTATSCLSDDVPTGPSEPPPEPEPRDTTPPVYVTRPPDGKLPWPQHDPSWTQARYQQDLADLWVVNNFALYQGSEDPTSLYLHDGLDVVLPNGTPIFAVASGTVRANLGGNQYYRTLVIEDDDEPGSAWGYTHVNSFEVQPGDHVDQGARLAVVNFSGLEHIHLDRLVRRSGGSWSVWTDLIHLQPDTFFTYTDTEAPVFEGRFRYVADGTDDAFGTPADGPTTVSGDVDVVVGLRDPGEWARSKVPFGGPDTYGDRNAPNRIEYEIANEAGETLAQGTSFDFSATLVPRGTPALSAAQVLSIYQHYESVRPLPPPIGNYNRKFNFYRVTNEGGLDADGRLDPDTRMGAWRTGALDESGARVFPDGLYVVTVRAADFKGNVAERADTVRVMN